MFDVVNVDDGRDRMWSRRVASFRMDDTDGHH